MIADANILVVEDEVAQLQLLTRILTREESSPPNILRATTATAACNQFRRFKPEVVILDLGLNGRGPKSGLELIAKLTSIDPTSRIIVLTGHVSEDIGVEAIKNGAASFLTKPVSPLMLQTLVRDYAQTATFRRNSDITAETPLPGFVGSSPPMRNVFRLIRQCANNDSNVLVVGETGTGKELVAKAIHQLSPRKQFNLAVYFGAAPASLAESELFGYAPGAYTGANNRGTDGSFKQADKGTLFIDELCSLDLELQRKLLRAVEDKTYKPLGSSVVHQSDFRLICSAQPRIYDLVRTGLFREDLLSRVEVITIALPPLRERREDILLLADYFLGEARQELSQTGVSCSVWRISKEATRLIREYAWPRNLRQLKHTIKNGVIQAQLRGGEQIDIVDIESRLVEVSSPIAGSTFKSRSTLRQAVVQLERQIIVDSLQRNDNVLSAVCQELGLGRTTLWRKLKELQLDP